MAIPFALSFFVALWLGCQGASGPEQRDAEVAFDVLREAPEGRSEGDEPGPFEDGLREEDSDLLDINQTFEDLSLEEAKPVEPLSLHKVSPDHGPSGSMTTVTLFGSGFAEGMEVFFGLERCLYTFVLSSTVANCSAPPQPPGIVDIRVSTPDGQEAILPNAFTYESLLSLYSVNPSKGPETGGTPVTIRGSGFLSEPIFLFGGRKAIEVKVVDDSTALAITPPHDPGPVSLIAVSPDGSVTLEDAFTYLEVSPLPSHPDLTLYGISPSAGPPEGGTTVYVTGKGFEEPLGLWIGALPAKSVKVLGPGIIKAVTPPGSPGLADVRLRVGAYEATLKDAFLYDPGTVSVLAVEPSSGAWCGGTIVRLYGYGLDRVTYVFFGPAPATDLKRLSPTEVTLRIPRSEVLGYVPVTIFGSNQAAIAEKAFFYYDPALSGGGTWGGPIRGALNITVYDGHNGARLKDAFVILGSDPDTRLKGRTDDRGQITLSELDLRGPVTLTAVREGYGAYTLADFDARNVSVYISPEPAPEDFGIPPSGQVRTCVVRGRIADFNKYFLKPVWVEGEPYVRCGTTATSMFGGTPDPGPGARVDSKGRFEIKTRTGNFAVVCLLAVLDPMTSAEIPLRIGLAKGLSCSDPEKPIEDVVVSLGMEMDGELWLGWPNLPGEEGAITGPAVIGAYDLGTDGWLELLKYPRMDGKQRVRFLGQPREFTGPLQGNGYSFYVTSSSASGTGMPYGVVLKTGAPSPERSPLLSESEAGFAETAWSTDHGVTKVLPVEDGKALVADTSGAVHLFTGDDLQAWKVHLHSTIYDMYGATSDDFFVACERGKFFHVVLGEANLIPTGITVDLTGVAGGGEAGVMVAGGAFLMRFDGQSMASEPIPTNVTLRDVAVLSDGKVLACGSSGAVVLGPPSGPYEVEHPTDKDLYGVISDGDGAWLVGAKGALLHYGPSTGFQVLETPTEETLRGVIVREGGVLVYGDRGTILLYDGTDFHDLSRPDLNVDLLAGAEVGDRVLLGGRRFLAIPAFIPFPLIEEPKDNSSWSRRRLAWSFVGSPLITHHQFILSGPSGKVFWNGMARGESREVLLPDLQKAMGYSPIPSGTMRMNLTSIRTPGFTIDAFISSQLNYYKREAFSVALSTFE